MLPKSDTKPWLLPPPKSYIFTNANLVDVAGGTIKKGVTVRTRNGLIESVSASSEVDCASNAGYETINLKGLYLCPGLIDCHAHLRAIPGTASLAETMTASDQFALLRQPYVCSQMLHRGFTTVRDCGGATLALKQAVEDGVFPGPRLFISCQALSQTGGHGDQRGSLQPADPCGCSSFSSPSLAGVCDGITECTRAVRENIRTGADFIKILASGGVASPTDKLGDLQFTNDELRAIVECATNAGKHVTAHAYTAAAIRHCVDNGVMGIEHGNLLDADTAKLMAEKGVFLTPTLIAYSEMSQPRWAGYLPATNADKNDLVLKAGLESLKMAAEAGVTICYGSDLLGPLGLAQTHEFVLRSQVLPAATVLQHATVNGAKMLRQEESLGQIKPGFIADMLVVASNPLEDVTIFDDPEKNVLGIMKEGRIYKSRCDLLEEDIPSGPKIKLSRLPPRQSIQVNIEL